MLKVERSFIYANGRLTFGRPKKVIEKDTLRSGYLCFPFDSSPFNLEHQLWYPFLNEKDATDALIDELCKWTPPRATINGKGSSSGVRRTL